jgi:hypothetical protein
MIMKKVIGSQGEVTIIQIDAMPEGVQTKPAERGRIGWIISHSEQGHHHCLTGGNVVERTDGVRQGMQVFYAMLDEPAQFVQDAATPHGKYDLEAGIYEFRIAREYDPFAEQVRKVAD